jgi:hypothetical protein
MLSAVSTCSVLRCVQQMVEPRLSDLPSMLCEPPTPPILIVTSDYDTPDVIKWQTAYAQKAVLDACVDAVTRYTDEHEDLTKCPDVRHDFLYDCWQSRLAAYFSYKPPEDFHPFLNRVTRFPHERYQHM